jgi:imidazole glycerol-phosphate synthase subunit HisH
MNKIGIIDTGIANLGSLAASIREVEVDYEIITDASIAISDFSHYILPGVGSFESGMTHLKKSGMDALVLKVHSMGVPLLGICLGMQMLCKQSEESKTGTSGLSIFDTIVKKLDRNEEGYWPKIGWSSVNHKMTSPLLNGIPSDEDFYFIHGFAVAVNDSTVSSSYFYNEYSAIISCGNTYGVQFHPEKSQKFGLKLLKNFTEIAS